MAPSRRVKMFWIGHCFGLGINLGWELHGFEKSSAWEVSRQSEPNFRLAPCV